MSAITLLPVRSEKEQRDVAEANERKRRTRTWVDYAGIALFVLIAIVVSVWRA